MNLEAADFPFGIPGGELLALVVTAMVVACIIGGAACTGIQNYRLRKLISLLIPMLFSVLFVVSLGIPLIRSADYLLALMLYISVNACMAVAPAFASYILIKFFGKLTHLLHKMLVTHDSEVYATYANEVIDPTMEQFRDEVINAINARIDEWMNQINTRIDERLNQINTRVDERLNQIGTDLGEWSTQFDARITEMYNGLVRDFNVSNASWREQLDIMKKLLVETQNILKRLIGHEEKLERTLKVEQRLEIQEELTKRILVKIETMLVIVAGLKDWSESMGPKRGSGVEVAEKNSVTPTESKIYAAKWLETYGMRVHHSLPDGTPNMLSKTSEGSPKVPICFIVQKFAKSAKQLIVIRRNVLQEYNYATVNGTDLVLHITNSANGRTEIRTVMNDDLERWFNHEISTKIIHDDEESGQSLIDDNEHAIQTLRDSMC